MGEGRRKSARVASRRWLGVGVGLSKRRGSSREVSSDRSRS